MDTQQQRLSGECSPPNDLQHNDLKASYTWTWLQVHTSSEVRSKQHSGLCQDLHHNLAKHFKAFGYWRTCLWYKQRAIMESDRSFLQSQLGASAALYAQPKHCEDQRWPLCRPFFWIFWCCIRIEIPQTASCKADMWCLPTFPHKWQHDQEVNVVLAAVEWLTMPRIALWCSNSTEQLPPASMITTGKNHGHFRILQPGDQTSTQLPLLSYPSSVLQSSASSCFPF